MRRLGVVLGLLFIPAWLTFAWATGSLTIPNTIFTQPNPVPTSLLDQNWQAIASYINGHEISFGALSARPVSGVSGRYYLATDQNGGTFYADNGTSWSQLAPAVNANIVQQLTGLGLANNGTATATFTIAVGAATSDDAVVANRVLMNLTTGLTKSLATWALGSAAGCLDTGAVAVFTWYHVFEIQRVDTGVVDAVCSTSATAPTMPANYTKKRRIGSIRTDWSTPAGSLYFFSQVGDFYRWATSTTTLDVNTATSGVVAVTATISTPNGVTTLALINLLCGNTASCYLSELAVTDELPAFGTAPQGSLGTVGGGNTVGQVQVMTDTASSIRRRSSQNTDIRINTMGYWDRRGQQ
jgi:hypothetical protein